MAIPVRNPKSVTIGTGGDTLVLKVSQSWYLVDAQYTIKVDGAQIGGTQTVSAINSTGQADTITVKGNWISGTHTVLVTLTNDAYDGYNWWDTGQSPNEHDRNIYVGGVTFNGVAVPNSDLFIYDSTPLSFTFTPSHAAKTITLGTGTDTLVLKISQSWYLTNAQYTIKVDGTQIGGTQTVGAVQSTGLADTVTVKGTWASGSHTVLVTLTNDAYDGYNWWDTGGSPDTHDRNIYVRNVTLNGVAVPNSDLDLYEFSLSFSFSKSPMPGMTPVPPAIANRSPVLTFSDEFETLNASASGPPNAKWYVDDPDGYGYGGIAQMAGMSALSVSNSILKIKGWNDGTGWKSGTIASLSPSGQGFRQKFGYFEARMKLPNTPGPWPAFWNTGAAVDTANSGGYCYEIDVAEAYTIVPTLMTGTCHWWGPNGAVRSWEGHSYNQDFAPTNFCTSFHTFGALWEAGNVTFYIDDQEVYTTTSGDDNVSPNYVIATMLFSPDDTSGATANPCYLEVDWIRVWSFT